jgi:hypothetical protein
MTILDEQGIETLVQETANRSNAAQEIYQRKDGTFIYCVKGMLSEIKKYLPANEQLRYIKTINPS